MTAPGTTIITTGESKTLNTIALGLGLVVGVLTVYYLVTQTKLIKMQIAKHEADKSKHLKLTQ